MTEPKSRAKSIAALAPYLYHWTVADDRIGGVRSDAYALVGPEGVVLVDPLPLEDEARLGELGPVRAICLTIPTHQRASWRLRDRFGAKIYAPRRHEKLEGRPDVEYDDQAVLPGGLVALHAPGPWETSFALWSKDRRILFLGDLLTHEPGEPLDFVPDEYVEAPKESRRSAARLAELPVEILCPGHGDPIMKHGQKEIREALARDAKKGP